jgi:hypothetical protein
MPSTLHEQNVTQQCNAVGAEAAAIANDDAGALGGASTLR